MHFRNVERGTFATYPMQPYSSDMYSGGYAGFFGGSYYADSGGYGWKYDAKDKSITMVFSPGGGLQTRYLPTDAKYAGIYAVVISGKEGMSKGAVKQIAEAAGGKETAPLGGGGGLPSWVLPAVAVVTLAGVAALAFWPTGKKA